jgi:hypothetical protein
MEATNQVIMGATSRKVVFKHISIYLYRQAYFVNRDHSPRKLAGSIAPACCLYSDFVANLSHGKENMFDAQGFTLIVAATLLTISSESDIMLIFRSMLKRIRILRL